MAIQLLILCSFVAPAKLTSKKVCDIDVFMEIQQPSVMRNPPVPELILTIGGGGHLCG